MKLDRLGSSLFGGFHGVSRAADFAKPAGGSEHASKAHKGKHAHGQEKLQSELAALIQKLQAFEKRFFGDSFDSSPTGSPATGASGGNTGVVAPSGSVSGGGSSGGAASDGTGSSGGVEGASNVVAGAGSSGIQTDDPRLAQALDLIYSDPDGKKLIDAAKAQGLTQVITNKSLNPDGGAGTQGETLSDANGQQIQIADPGGADLIQTLAHELGHAATPGDGDSETEEATVDALGNQIQERLLGRSAQLHLDTASYTGLGSDNGIKLDLAQLGIIVP